MSTDINLCLPWMLLNELLLAVFLLFIEENGLNMIVTQVNISIVQ